MTPKLPGLVGVPRWEILDPRHLAWQVIESWKREHSPGGHRTPPARLPGRRSVPIATAQAE
jgi:hypothetical protein